MHQPRLRIDSLGSSILCDLYMIRQLQPGPQRGCQQPWRDAAGQGLVHEAGIAGSRVEACSLGGALQHLPIEAAPTGGPVPPRLLGIADGDVPQLGLRQRDQATAAAIAGRKTRL